MDDDDTSLEELARRAQQGDRAAAQALLTAVRPWVERAIARNQHNPEDVADITQRVLAKLARNLGQYRHPAPFKPWATVIIRHEAIDHFRKVGRIQDRDQAWFDGLPPGSDRSPALEDEVDFLVDLARHLADLEPPIRRAILWEFLVLGLTPADLERAHPECAGSIRYWLGRDATTIYRRIYGSEDGPEGGRR